MLNLIKFIALNASLTCWVAFSKNEAFRKNGRKFVLIKMFI